MILYQKLKSPQRVTKFKRASDNLASDNYNNLKTMFISSKSVFLKLSLLIFAVFSINQTTHAQIGPYLRAITFNNNVYNTKTDLTLSKFAKKDGELLSSSTKVILKPVQGKTIRYKILGTDGDYTIVKLLPQTKLNSNNTITVGKPSSTAENATEFLYSIKTDDFGLYQKNLLSQKIVGTPLVFPFKLRLQDRGEGALISTDFTLGYTFGIRLKTSKLPFRQNFLTLVPYGFGLGSTKYFYKTETGYSDKSDAVAITYYSGGLVYTHNKINFGFFAGRDAMIDKKNDWAYQGDWWLSFGLGFKFSED
jgi:hypothetical protein